MSLNDISKNDEKFLKEFLKNFYRQIIKIENYNRFENILTEWIKYFFMINRKDSKITYQTYFTCSTSLLRVRMEV